MQAANPAAAVARSAPDPAGQPSPLSQAQRSIEIWSLGSPSIPSLVALESVTSNLAASRDTCPVVIRQRLYGVAYQTWVRRLRTAQAIRRSRSARALVASKPGHVTLTNLFFQNWRVIKEV